MGSLSNKVLLHITGESLSDYKGINSFGKTGIVGYIKRICRAYKEFLLPTQGVSGNMYPFSAKKIYVLFVILMIIVVIIGLVKVFRVNKNKTLQYVCLFLLYPLAAYFIYFMVDASEVHSLMTYGEVYIFALAIWIIDNIENKNKIQLCLNRIVIITIAILIFFNIRLSNICYLKAEFIQAQAISYFTTLSTRIQSIDEYSDEMSVVYINEFNKEDDNLYGTDNFFNDISLIPYSYDSLINEDKWKMSMERWCGFSPTIGDSTKYNGNLKVKQMPCYPDNGSIKIIDGQIVVKFADE